MVRRTMFSLFLPFKNVHCSWKCGSWNIWKCWNIMVSVSDFALCYCAPISQSFVDNLTLVYPQTRKSRAFVAPPVLELWSGSLLCSAGNTDVRNIAACFKGIASRFVKYFYSLSGKKGELDERIPLWCLSVKYKNRASSWIAYLSIKTGKGIHS